MEEQSEAAAEPSVVPQPEGEEEQQAEVGVVQLEEAVVLLILRHRIRGHMIQCQICPSQDRPVQPEEVAQPEEEAEPEVGAELPVEAVVEVEPLAEVPQPEVPQPEVQVVQQAEVQAQGVEVLVLFQ